MTNAEKFKEVFGFDVDIDICPRADMDCERCVSNGIPCERRFWYSEYQGEPTIPLSVIEKITTEIEERATYEGIYLDRADVLDIIDKAVKECTHEPT